MITKEEVIEGVEQNPELFCAAGVCREEVVALHKFMDTDFTGSVPISELLFGILKLTTAAKTIDMMALDHRQKGALREMAEVARISEERFHAIGEALKPVKRHVKQLSGELRSARRAVEKTVAVLGREVERLEGALHDAIAAGRQQETVDVEIEESRKRRKDRDARRDIEGHLLAMRIQAETLLHVLTQRATAGLNMEDGGFEEALRRGLDEEVRPWLLAQLAHPR